MKQPVNFMSDYNDYRGGYRGRGRGGYRGRGDGGRGGYSYRGGGGPYRGSGSGGYGYRGRGNYYSPYPPASNHRGNHYGSYNRQPSQLQSPVDQPSSSSPKDPHTRGPSKYPRESYESYKPQSTPEIPKTPKNPVANYLNITDKAVQSKLDKYQEDSDHLVKLQAQRFKCWNQYQVLKIQMEKDQLNIDINHEKLQEMSFM